ncbi:MAG: glycosyltransferase family 4 protein [Thermodesulfovibrio sp.]
MNKKITVLHTESSKGWGGQEIRILQEAIGMRERGYRVLIATEKDGNLYQRALKEGLEVFPINFSKYNPLSFLRIKSLIEKERVDIVNTHSSKDSWIATIAAKMAFNKPKIIRTRHLSTPISKSYLSKIIYDIIPDLIITTGEAIRENMIKIHKFNPKKIVSIPTGVDLNKFNPDSVKPMIDKDRILIGSIGILRSWKGHEYLLKAIPLVIKKIKKVHFYIVGDGPQFNNLKKLIEELKIENYVSMLGYVEDTAAILKSLDILIHPSTSNEGVPQVVLQALSMRVPVIACNVGSIGEIIKDKKTGILIEPKNSYAIYEAILEILKDNELKSKIIENGFKLVEEHYSFNKMLNKIENLYIGLLKNDINK